MLKNFGRGTFLLLFQPIVLQEDRFSMVKSKVLHSSLGWLELPFQLVVCFPSEQLKKAWL